MIGMWAVDGTEMVCLRLILLIRARIPKRTISAFCSHCPPPDPLFTLSQHSSCQMDSLPEYTSDVPIRQQ